MAIGDPTDTDLVSGTTAGNTLEADPSFTEREITFGAGVELTSGVTYAIVVRGTNALTSLGWNIALGYANGSLYSSANSGTSWSVQGSDCWFKTKAEAVEKDTYTFSGSDRYGASLTSWTAQTFIATSTYTITSVVLKLNKLFSRSPGTVTVSIRATAGPGKATTPTPTDDQEGIIIAGVDRIKQLIWDAPSGETPDYLIYFRASGGAWVLQETITDDSTSHTLSSTILDGFSYYSIYEWRVDTRENGGTTTGDTWTFISQVSSQFTDYTRRSDYDADKVWQPGTGWVDINTFAYTGGGSFKSRILVVGHKVVYFGDI